MRHIVETEPLYNKAFKETRRLKLYLFSYISLEATNNLTSREVGTSDVAEPLG